MIIMHIGDIKFGGGRISFGRIVIRIGVGRVGACRCIVRFEDIYMQGRGGSGAVVMQFVSWIKRGELTLTCLFLDFFSFFFWLLV
jgi:hypothetical protein